MKISVLCTSRTHPVFPHLEAWCAARRDRHEVELVEKSAQLSGGDLLFLVSCNEIVRKPVRDRYRATLVLHAAAVPVGRGMSPHVWQILEGKHEITVTLLEAEDKVDTGRIWAQRPMRFEGHELFDEINARLFEAELALMQWAVENAATVQPRPQPDLPPTYYRRRNPDDSRLDPEASIASQFELLRVADPDRFPAFFDLRGHRYTLRIEKVRDPEPQAGASGSGPQGGKS